MDISKPFACVVCERDSSGTTEPMSAKHETAKVMERIARREGA
jgi:hypothetical protein